MKKEKKQKEAAENGVDENVLEKEKSEKRSEMDKQLKWVIGMMIAVVVIAIIIYFIVQGKSKFYYGGLDFEKVMYDKLLLYHAKIPITSQTGAVVANYNLFLRNDPRHLEDINVSGKIRLKTKTIVSLDPEAETGCTDAGLTGASFFSFLKYAGIQAGLAYSDKNYSLLMNKSFVNCDTNTSASVIMIEKGDRNEVRQEKQDCYVIEFKDCDILKATERFMVAMIAHSRGYDV